MNSKILCSHCGQDWLKPFITRNSKESFHMCPECESIWLEGQDIHDDTEMYLGEFLESRGISWGGITESTT
ncbi:hypothetical protein [Streptomyces sp. NPDC088719]|uniref:hypothetical protein n=1 Tax=Streptomyces sp. NPDC088719 TaxID=3365872 RepID=UPI00381F758C